MKVPESTVRDAMNAGTITEPAATVIADLGLANSPGAYRSIALEPTAEAQVAKAREIASQKEEAAPAPTGTSLEGGTAALIVAWKNASSAERRHFLRLIGHSDCSALMGLGRSTQARTKVNGSSTATVNGSTPRAPKQQLVLDWPEPHCVADRAGNKGSK